LVKEAENFIGDPQITELAQLKLCNVKPRNDPEHQFCFELVDANMKKPIIIQTESELATNEWINTIRGVTERALSRGSTFDIPTNLALTLSKTESDHKDNKEANKNKTNTCSTTTMGNDKSNQQKNKQALINEIIKSNVCADCDAKDPSWVSLNLGVIICINCSGAHRQFG